MMYKYILIWCCASLLASCSLFTKTPSQVVQGERGIYQGLLIIDDNLKSVLNEYEKDCKATISYHLNYIYEQKIDPIRKEPDLTKEEKSAKIAELEAARDQEIKDTYTKIEAKKAKMLTDFEATINPVKQLTESVYNYLSTTPITIDNVDYWIAKIKQAANGQ